MKKVLTISTSALLFAIALYLNTSNNELVSNEAFAGGCCHEETNSICEWPDGDLWNNHYWQASGGGNVDEDGNPLPS